MGFSRTATMLTSVMKVPLGLVVSIFITAAVPAAFTVLLTSGMSPLSRHVYYLLGAGGHDERTESFMLAILVGVVMLLVGYILDIGFLTGAWKGFARAYTFAAVGLVLAGVLGFTPQAPSIPVILGIAVMALSVAGLRTIFCAETSVEQFSVAAGLAFFGLSLLLVVVWWIWAFSTILGGYATWTLQEAMFAERGFRPLTSFVMWSSPVIMSVGCFLMAIFTLVRSQFHVPDDLEQPLDTQAVAYIRGELQTVMMCLGLAVISVWVAASLAAQDFALSESVLRLSASTIIGIVVYVCSSIGLERIRVEAEKSAAVRESQELLTGDWVKGLFVLLCMPLIPVYFAVEAIHHFARRCLWFASGSDTRAPRMSVQLGYGSEPEWLAREARGFWLNIASWDKAAVLTKTMYMGLVLFALQVVPSQALPLLLSLLNERIAALSLLAILCVLFCVGIILFMLPPVPGLPIYLLTSVIVTERCAINGLGFQIGCVISISFSFCLKMTAGAVQMKVIGGPLSKSLAVKKAIGVHTPTLKSIKYMLSQDGFRLDKIAVLCGGPDWPTYVTAGILNLPVSEMLLGGSPILMLIVPFCLTSAYTTRAGRESDPVTAQYYHYLSSVMAIVSSMLMLLNMSIAGYCVHRTSEAHREEFESGELCMDPQEDAVISSIEADEKAARALAHRMGWQSMPLWLKFLMILGAGLCSLMVHVLLEPVPAMDAFRDFQLTDSISSLPHGSALAIIQGPGWFCLICFATTCCILALQRVWGVVQSSGGTDEEDPLQQSGNRTSSYDKVV